MYLLQIRRTFQHLKQIKEVWDRVIFDRNCAATSPNSSIRMLNQSAGSVDCLHGKDTNCSRPNLAWTTACTWSSATFHCNYCIRTDQEKKKETKKICNLDTTEDSLSTQDLTRKPKKEMKINEISSWNLILTLLAFKDRIYCTLNVYNSRVIKIKYELT